MRVKVNGSCNVLTGDDTTGYRPTGRPPAPQVTIPRLRANLSIHEARNLVTHLIEAITVAEEHDKQ